MLQIDNRNIGYMCQAALECYVTGNVPYNDTVAERFLDVPPRVGG